jgi:dienelactone hydrolase
MVVLICGILLSACARQSVKFESAAINSSYTATLEAFLKTPEGDGPFPAVVLMHGCGGLSDAVRRGMDDHAEYLVSRGFATFVVDSFSARGKADGRVCSKLSELASARHYRQFDAYHALEFLQSQPYVDVNNIFLMGQSNGGSVALVAARGALPGLFPGAPHFQAIVAYYPWCGALPTRPSKIVSPLLVLGAGKDDWVAPDYCVSARDQVSGADYDVLVYEDAYHSFDLPISVQEYSGHLVGGNLDVTRDSREKMIDWFLTHSQ